MFSTTSEMKRASWSSGSQSSREGGRRKDWDWSYWRKRLCAPPVSPFNRGRPGLHFEELVADPIICHGQISQIRRRIASTRTEGRANQPFGVIDGF